jgi:hypothetical protein
VSDPGPFGLVLSSTGSLLGVPAGDGILSLTGFGWVAGDPVEITVTVVPEPRAAAGLATACGGAWWGWRRRRTKLAATPGGRSCSTCSKVRLGSLCRG